MAVDYSGVSSALNAEGIDITADFFTLYASQVECLVSLARVQGYRKPKNANGSTARHYFAALQRDYFKFKKGA